MAALLASLKENWKTLLGGIVLGALLGAGIAGYLVYLNQEPGRKALIAVAKAGEESAACTASLKDVTDQAAQYRESCEKTTAAKTELDVQLADAKAEIAKLTAAAAQKQPTRPAGKAPEAKTKQEAKSEAKKQAPTYSRTYKKREKSSAVCPDEEPCDQNNWEQGL